MDKKTGRDLTMIYHDVPEEVPNVRFYRRRLLKGDLAMSSETELKAGKELLAKLRKEGEARIAAAKVEAAKKAAAVLAAGKKAPAADATTKSDKSRGKAE